MKESDRGNEMLELKEKSATLYVFFSLLSCRRVDRLIFSPKMDPVASHNPPCLSPPDKDRDSIVYFNLTFSLPRRSLPFQSSPNSRYERGAK